MPKWKIFLILLRTAIFTAIVPYIVGLWLPTQVNRPFSESFIRIEPQLWQEILGATFLTAGAAMYLWRAWDFSVKGFGTPAPIVKLLNALICRLKSAVRRAVSHRIDLCEIPCTSAYFYEEPHLRKIFGDQYLDYRKRVLRWIPRLRFAQ